MTCKGPHHLPPSSPSLTLLGVTPNCLIQQTSLLLIPIDTLLHRTQVYRFGFVLLGTAPTAVPLALEH